jgi:toxin HigB-1
MIRNFRDRKTKRLFDGDGCAAEWRSFENVALRKLDMLDQAVKLEDMRAPPGNRLEALKGNRSGQWSIRINQQWRICFRWSDEGPLDVEIVDYH